MTRLWQANPHERGPGKVHVIDEENGRNHLTYKNMGDEFLWELRAVCPSCHTRAHTERRG